MFVDSRYWTQASKQLDRNWTVVKVGSPETVDWAAYLPTLEKGAVVGMDARLVDYRTVKALQESLVAVGVELKFVEENLVDLAWGVDQPKRSAEGITTHSSRFAGTLDEASALLSILIWIRFRDFRRRQDCQSSSVLGQGRTCKLSSLIAAQYRLDLEPSRKR